MFGKKVEAPLPAPEHKHMWEKWEKQRVTGLVPESITTTSAPSGYGYTTVNKNVERQIDIQERRCTICGYYERQQLGVL